MNKKEKHSHKGESVIGKIIYGFLLFLPLFAIGVTCLVSTFNRNVNIEEQQNYTITTINDYEDLQRGKEYYFNSYDLNQIEDTTQHYTTFIVNNLKIEQSPYNTEQINNIEQRCTYFRIYRQNNYNGKGACLLYYFDKNNTTIYNGSITMSNQVILKFNFDKILQEANYNTLDNSIYQKIYSDKNTQNVFYYAIEQVENSNLFNWSKNSIIYTGINEFTTALNITNTFMPMLLTYWLLISVVYFLYDIILMCVLVIHKKLHQLQDDL